MTVKNILVIFSGDISASAVGGIKNYIYQLIVNRNDVKIDLLALCQQGESCSIPGVNHLFALKARFRPYIVSFHLEIIKAFVTGRLRLQEYDTVIFNRHEDILLLPLIRAKRRILLIHGSICYGFKFWPLPVAILNYILEKFLLPFMDSTYVLLKNSKYGIGYYKRSNPWCAEKIHYAPVPIAKVFFSEDVSQIKHLGNKLRLVYFGRIVQNPKNIFLFPEYVRSLVSRGIDAELTIIGDGPDTMNLQKKIDAMGLSDRFNFLGTVAVEQLPGLLLNFDLTLIFSNFEGVCMSAIESLSLGIPVAAFPVGDIEQYIVDMKNGVLLNKNDSVDVNTDKIIEFIIKYEYKKEFIKLIKPYLPDVCFSHIVL